MPKKEVDNKIYGENIKRLRKKKKLTQKGLSERIDELIKEGMATTPVAEITIRKYEIFLRIPQTEQLKSIAAALDVSIDDLMTETQPADNENIIYDAESDMYFDLSLDSEKLNSILQELTESINTAEEIHAIYEKLLEKNGLSPKDRAQAIGYIQALKDKTKE